MMPLAPLAESVELILFVLSCAHVPSCIEATTFAKVLLAADVLCTSKSMQPNAISMITTMQLSSFMAVSSKGRPSQSSAQCPAKRWIAQDTVDNRHENAHL